MLWMSSLRPAKKVGLMILFGGGFLVIACATLRCVLIVTVRPSLVDLIPHLLTNNPQDPINGAQLAGGWAVGELDDDAARTLRERSVILDRIG